jgi:hypothetical protein
MKYINILLEFFATADKDKWEQTYFALLPYELLDKIFTVYRDHQLIATRQHMFSHFACRRRGIGKTIFGKENVHFPYFTPTMHLIEQNVSIDASRMLVTVRFFKPGKIPHFTIYTFAYSNGKNLYFTVLDWKYSPMRNNVGKGL